MSCNIPTFIGEMPSAQDLLDMGLPVSTEAMHRIQAERLNPALKSCRESVRRGNCPVEEKSSLAEMAARVALKLG